jgi:Icc-related predicted phosphoesterase
MGPSGRKTSTNQAGCSLAGEVEMATNTVRIGAVGDLHYGRDSRDTLKPLFQAVQDARPDVMLLLGDLTDYGTIEEAQALTRELVAGIKVPTLAVLGNHDYESNAMEGVRHIFREGGITILDGDSCEVKGIGFAGVKGFGGGFGRGALGPWGEETVKRFVNEAVQEALKLESALARLRTSVRIVLLHYAPIADTVVGEPLEIYPYLGSSRLAEPLGRLSVTAIFHGHAHRGAPEGRTVTGTPVYNVALPLLTKLSPEQPLKILEVDVASTEAAQLPLPQPTTR